MRPRTAEAGATEFLRLVQRYASSEAVAERASSSRTNRCKRLQEELLDACVFRENELATRAARMLVAAAELELEEADDGE